MMRFFTTIFVISLIQGLVHPATVEPDIIVIGGGASGIAAATRLLKNGFRNVKILEAENRIGGRINSVQFGDAYVDLGAEFCDGEVDNIIYTLAKNLDVLKSPAYKTRFYRSNGEPIDDNTANRILKFAVSLLPSNESIPGCEQVESVGKCLAIKSKSFTSSANNEKEKQIFIESKIWTNAFLCLKSPLNLSDLNLHSAYKVCEGPQGINWNGHGFKTILDIMMEKFPNPKKQLPILSKIHLNQTVISISNWQNSHKVTVKTSNGSIFEADHVIFTPSLGVLKANYDHLFEPSLPKDKIDSIRQTGYGATLKVIMHFPEKWYEDNIHWVLVWTEDDKNKAIKKNLEWLLGLERIIQADNNPNVLHAWYMGSHVPHIETLPDNQIREGQEYLINTFLASHYNVTMPDKILRTFWYSNPNFRGTYSYDSTENRVEYFREKLARPLKNQNGKLTILFAGEATHPYYFGTVHGAIDSGYREADTLINFYNGNVTAHAV